MLSQATASVTSGLSSVIETVETSLGVPDPEEMARKVKEDEKVVKEKAAEAKSSDTSEESKSESANEGQWIAYMYVVCHSSVGRASLVMQRLWVKILLNDQGFFICNRP